MIHLAAFNTNVAATSVNQDLALVTDGWLAPDPSGKALLPTPCQLIQCYGLGTGIDKLRAIALSLKGIAYPRIPRFDAATAPPDLPAYGPFADYPPRIRAVESFNFQSDKNNGAAQRHTALAWLQDRYEPPPAGPSTVLYGTASITGSAFAWDNGAITWEDNYPSIRMAVIGLRVVGANLIGARLIPPNGGMRPGTIATAAETTDDFLTVWNGSMGKLLEFTPPVFPLLDLFKNAAAVTQRIYLQVVPISGMAA